MSPKTSETAQAEKVYTESEVQAKLDLQKNELRKIAVEKISEKNLEIKDKEYGLILAGQDEFYNLAKWEVMKKMADDMVKSGALPRGDNAYTVMMKMQAGREMGLKPIESIKSFYIVNGVLSIFGDAVIRRLREHGYKVLPYKEADNTCTATIEKDGEKYSETFTFEEAEKSGWTKSSSGLKPGWILGINRRRKLRYGAMSTLIKTYVPEVLGAASDIAEVAEDTVPLYKKDRVEAALASDVELSQDILDQLYEAKDLKELAVVCKKLIADKGEIYRKPLMQYYEDKKQAIASQKKEEAV